MFIAKEALNKEIVNIMRQVDKTNMEKDEMMRGVKFLENYIREQEKTVSEMRIKFGKPDAETFYQDDPKDVDGQDTNYQDPNTNSKINRKIVSIRAIESINEDPLLHNVFRLYNSHLRLNIDQRIELFESALVQ